MHRWLEGIVATVLLVFAVWALVRLSSWAIEDARRRNKSALFVRIAVVRFFPWGLIAWLLFRPAVTSHSDTQASPASIVAGR
jgi:hypothetical protein